MRVVNSAQLSFAITCGLGFYSPDFPTLAMKPPSAIDAFLPPELSPSPTFIKSGYNFSMAGTALAGAPATCNGLPARSAAPGYAVVADPLDQRRPGARFFGTNADGIIYEDTASSTVDHARDRRASGRRAHQVAIGSGSRREACGAPDGSQWTRGGRTAKRHGRSPTRLDPNRPRLF